MLSVYKDSSDVSPHALPTCNTQRSLTFSLLSIVPTRSFRLPKEAYLGLIALLQDVQQYSFIDDGFIDKTKMLGMGMRYDFSESR
jgi:hypothetical protein